MASTGRCLDGDVASTTPLPRSFADLRPVAIHFHRSREQPRVRIGTAQLMGVPPATETSTTPSAQLEPEPHVRWNEPTVGPR